MRIIIVIQDSKRKKVVFITDSGKALLLSEAIEAFQKCLLEHIHLLKTKHGIYLRSNLNTFLKDNLNHMVLTYNIFTQQGSRFVNEGKAKILYQYLSYRSKELEAKYNKSDLIFIEGLASAYIPDVISKVNQNIENIKKSAKEYQLDPYLLSAILVDEYCRRSIDDRFDFLAIFGVNTSVGLAQVKISTGREVLKKGYFTKLSASISSKDLYYYLIQDKYSIDFAAARIRQTIDYWLNNAKKDISKNIAGLGYLYSFGLGDPRESLKISDRGLQIQNEFYPFSQKIFSKL